MTGTVILRLACAQEGVVFIPPPVFLLFFNRIGTEGVHERLKLFVAQVLLESLLDAIESHGHVLAQRLEFRLRQVRYSVIDMDKFTDELNRITLQINLEKETNILTNHLAMVIHLLLHHFVI